MTTDPNHLPRPVTTTTSHLSVVVTYLEMDSPQAHRPPVPAPPFPGVTLHRVCNPTPGYYRTLYDGVGEEWLWHERRQLSPAQLRGILHSPKISLLVLRCDRRRVGFAELDRREPKITKLTYFGLLPAWIGRGLGPWFLSQVVDAAWGAETTLLRVNTCTLDHPAALPLYRAAGFKPVRHVVRQIPDPRLCGLLPRTAAPHIPLG